ncbi:MAG: energy-coupling factor transporter transmembrane component T [Bacillota bacterium]|jgi:energy-coupling factor transport system permease protein
MSVAVNYLQRDTWIHRLNPLTKLFWSLLMMTLSFLFKDPLWLTALFGSIVLVAQMAQILREMLPVFKGLLIFALFFLLFQIFLIPEGRTLVVLIPGLNWLRITDQGVGIAAALGIRLMAVASSFPVLLATTQVKDLVVMLVEKLKIPYTYAFMLITTLRFIPTFMNEMDQIIQAQCSRAHRLDSRNFVTRFLSICPLAIPLMVTSIKKAERLAISMETRGFGVGKRTYFHRRQFTAADIGANLTLALIGITALIMAFKGILT